MTKDCLITGAEGFIGSHLVEELVREGKTVRAYVLYNFENRRGWIDSLPKEIQSEIEIVVGDVRDPFSVRNAVKGCSTVYHLAALIGIPYSYASPMSYEQTNITGTLNILQASLDESVSKIVHTSTSETYGSAQYTPIDEKHPLVGQSPYSASKVAADKLAESYYLSFDLPVATIRPFNTFGPRQSARAVIPTIISQALSGAESIELGALDPVRDLTYVKDTVAGFIAIANSSKTIGRVTNIGYGKGISIGNLAQLILEIIGKEVEVKQATRRLRPENSEVMELVCDNTFATQELGWQPKTTLRQGLELTQEWLKSHRAIYKHGEYVI